MTSKRCLFLTIVICLLARSPSALAACASNQIEIVGQMPDIVFVAGGSQTECQTAPNGHLQLPWTSIENRGFSCGVFLHSESTNIGISTGAISLAFGNVTLSHEIMAAGLPPDELRKSLPFCIGKSATAGASSGTVELFDPTCDTCGMNRRIGAINWYIMQRPQEYPLAFVHTATYKNSFDHFTLIDNAFTNGNPWAKILVTPRFLKDYKSYNHKIGVFYSFIHKKWAVFNQDHAPMRSGVAFNIRLEGNSGLRVQANTGNTADEKLYLDIPAANNNPRAAVYVTASSSITASPHPSHITPDQKIVVNDHPVGVGFDEERGRWYIANEDGARMPLGVAFNVKIVSIPDFGVVKTFTAVANDKYLNNFMIIDRPDFSDPEQIVFATHRISTPSSKVLNPHPTGVYYEGTHWAVSNLDGKKMPIGSAFNVFAAMPPVKGR